MPRLKWDETGKKKYQVGIHNVALFVSDSSTENGYADGVAWNGVSAVNESPSGAEANDFYANDSKYGSIRSSEQFGGTIEAFTSPVEFDVCDGSATIAPGAIIHQQTRKPFGLAYMNTIGNDVDGMDYGEVLHLVYNATASPGEVNHETVNESPDISPISWEFDTTPVAVPGYKPASHFEFRSDEMDKDAWKTLLDTVYGSDDSGANKTARLPKPETLLEIVKAKTASLNTNSGVAVTKPATT